MNPDDDFQHHAPSRKDKTSDVLKEVLHDLPDGDIRFGDLIARFRRRSFGGLLLLSAALGMLPAISVPAGIITIVIGLQMFAGLRAPLFPRFIRERSLDSGLVTRIGSKLIRYTEPVERFVKPRALFLTASPMPNLIGLLVVILGAVMAPPLPFSNLPPAIALLFISAGLLEHDGLMILIGFLLAATALAIGGFVAVVAIEGIVAFFENS